MNEIFSLHEIPKTIISHRDVKFTSNFWNTLVTRMGRKLNFITSYHPTIDQQTQMIDKVLEGMLHMYIMRIQPTKWEDYLHLVEFPYNNSYWASLKMSPFQVLYGMKCHISLSWSQPKHMDISDHICHKEWRIW